MAMRKKVDDDLEQIALLNNKKTQKKTQPQGCIMLLSIITTDIDKV